MEPCTVATAGIVAGATLLLAKMVAKVSRRRTSAFQDMDRISRDFRATIDKLSDDTLRQAIRIRYGR